jgi:hypothetical protein
MVRLFVLLFSFLSLSLPGQDLFMPRNLAKAYKAGTRDASGAPGAKYWQNHAEYRIVAKLDLIKSRITGTEIITYHNESPDTLKTIVIKLNADLYKKGGARGYDLTPADILEKGVELRRILADGVTLPDSMKERTQTILSLKLVKPLLPKSEIELEIDWAFDMPEGEDAPRICICDKTTWFVAYWYPQVAVYDDIHGWNTTPYNGTQEFYNDFNDYDVSIEVPKKMMVWGTGELQNEKTVFTEAVLKKYQAAHETDSVVQIWTEKDMKLGRVLKSSGKNVFHYKATSVPDFAFGVSDHFNWDATSLKIPGTDRRTFIGAAYYTSSKDYKAVADIARDAIYLMSTWLPGYPFPYPSMTVFNGNDGMEYPMMCNDASTWPRPATGLTAHEISHTYFPFMMGINEQMYAWMDEGWAAFFDYMLTDSLKNKHGGDPGTRNYDAAAGNEWDVPPMVQSRFLSSPAYRTASYVRPQAAYFTLRDMLGHDEFQKCMRYYMDTWKGKHPMPYDFFYTWNKASGRNLNWFWKPWFFEWGYPDLGIESVDNSGKAPMITIKRNGNIPTGIKLEVNYNDNTTEVIRKGADVWSEGATEIKLNGQSGKQIKSVMLGEKTIPDTDKKNNSWGVR